MTDSYETRANKLREDLDYVLACNPRRLEPAKAPPRPTIPPHAFYNKHIDDRPALRRLLPLGSLVQNIAEFAQEHLDYSALADADCNKFPTAAFREYLNARPSEPVTGPETIADRYSRSVGRICGGLATKLLSPSLPRWNGIIHWGRRAEPDKTPTGVDDNSYASFFLDDEGKLLLFGDHSLLEKSLLEDFERVATFAPRIGAWIFLSLSAESEALLRDLGRITTRPSFAYRFCKTIYPASSASSRPLPRDASSAPWTFPSSTTEVTDSYYPAAPKRSLRSKASGSSQLSVGVVPSVSRRRKRRRMSLCLSQQRRSYNLPDREPFSTDSTMIILNCGNYEHICIRHRETQTLYISNLFDVTSCKNPGYIKLYVGVFLSQTLDAISRMKDAQKNSSQSTRKRPNTEDIAPVPNKRRRGNLKATEPQTALMLASRRDMMLFHLHTRSGANQEIFFPLNGLILKPHEYFEIILTSKLGDGATGIVHGAMARVTTKARRRKSRRQVGLSTPAARVNAIRVYGLFEDLEGGAIALVMSNCGTNLWQLRPDKKTARTSVTPAQRERFIEILESVHRAGVRHYDIRAANLMLNNAGEAFIVDFDRGRLNPSEGKKEAEMDILREAMEGLPTDKIASLPTPGDDAEIWLATRTDTWQ
ncbi:hypothetical protein C8F01DRAFT_1375792 [Mycena amicta]|nr:hypothetical protein C8F01DRAFT_1375792 [Mycena amicta]